MAQPIATLIAALIVVVGGGIAYWLQRRIDRREELIRTRRNVYNVFLEALFDHVEKRTEESRYNYDKRKIELLLVASDKVLEELVWLQEAAVMDMDAVGPFDVHQRMHAVIDAMRKDCFEKSEIEEVKLSYLNPVGRPTPLFAAPEGHFEP